MSIDPSSSSTSKSPIVTKILIDLSEYNKLLDLKKHFEQQEQKLSQQLKSSVHNVQKGEGEHQVKENVSPTSVSNEENSESKIVKAVISVLQSQFGLVLPTTSKPSTSQTGAGNNFSVLIT